MLANIITLSTYCPQHRAYTERTVWLMRPYRLTYTGAARILRRTNQLGSDSVVRLECASVA